MKKDKNAALCRDIIVVGASMGGVSALKQLVEDLPGDLPAAVFLVLHLSPEFKSYLTEILTPISRMKVMDAKDFEQIRLGCIYVGIPDYHLLIQNCYVRLGHGPKENMQRPAVDTLFFSAAQECGARTIGVVLTGALDCGTAGLMAIKQRGGLAIVQDPTDAVNPSMPRSALENVPTDFCLPVAKMGALLSTLAGQPVDLVSDLVSNVTSSKTRVPESSKPTLSSNVCPECNAPLWCVETGNLLHFRCRIGHGFSGESLLIEKTQVLETALWSTVNAFKDKADIARLLAKRAGANHQKKVKEHYLKHAVEAESYARAATKWILGEDSLAELTEKKHQIPRKKSEAA